MTQREMYEKATKLLTVDPTGLPGIVFQGMSELVRRLIVRKRHHRLNDKHRLHEYQDRQFDIFLTKYLHGFNVTDIAKDLQYLRGEVDEVEGAIQENNAPHIVEELADVVIYCYGMAQMLDMRLDDAIFEKMKYNSVRKYPTDLE